jgi:flagellar biosynthesis protein FlhF
MRLKSYFSGTVEAAMERARRELGEDALLVNARPSTPDTRSLGAFEVVFGVPDGAPIPRQIAAPADAFLAARDQSPAPPNDSQDRLTQERLLQERLLEERVVRDRLAQDVADVKRQLERLGQSLRHPRLLPAAGTPEGALYTRLIEAELEPALAQLVAEGAPLEELFTVDATLGRRSAASAVGVSRAGVSTGGVTTGGVTTKDRAVVALVGPPGAGKTTTLVKLAARYGLASRRPAQILSVDVCRIAAADQLRTFASILGIPCEIVETPAALAQAIEEYRHKDFIFIDTPGYAGDEMEEARELAAMVSAHPEIDTHLVLMASTKPVDLAGIVDRYEMFSPHKLIFTRMDETQSFGPLLNEAARRALPISFLSSGQTIPDDLEPATKPRLAARVKGRDARSAGAAA